MENLQWIIPLGIVFIGAVVHIEVNLATLKNDVKWIKKTLNPKEG